MSTRIAAQEMRELAELAKVNRDDVRQVIGTRSGAGAIEIAVPIGFCLVVVAIEDFNPDLTAARTISFSQNGVVVTPVRDSDGVLGGDVFYVFTEGTAAFTFAATALAGTTYRARVLGYTLPARAYQSLSRMSSRIS